MKLYGIPNCDTVKKARNWLTAHDTAYEFHDFKKHGVTEAMLSNWLKQVGWQKLLKKTGPTWGKLSDTVKTSIKDDASALALMLEQPNVIKRPVLEHNGKVLATGFSGQYDENLFARAPHPNPLVEQLANRLSPQAGKSLVIPQAGEGTNE
ncbi:MAG: ArsC family reductase [Gallionellaceae bacterium]|nr:MAG: ArsC family reductase [Gallionellaceae bacterium]